MTSIKGQIQTAKSAKKLLQIIEESKGQVSDNTLTTYISIAKKQLKTDKAKDKFQEQINEIFPDLYKRRNKEIKKKVVSKLKSVTLIEKVKVENLIPTLREIDSLWSKILITTLATGRRPIEIFTGQFEYRDDTSFFFSGIAKQKNDDRKDEVFILPSLFITTREILSLIKEIHEDRYNWHTMENTEISSIISKPMNRTISKLDLGITAYNFRHLWVNYIVEHKRQLLDNIPFGGKTIDWDSVRDVIIYTILLGHDENDLQTQNSYKSISII